MTALHEDLTRSEPFEPTVGAGLEHAVEDQPTRWLFAPFDVAAAWLTSWAMYSSSLLDRRIPLPLQLLSDTAKFWQTANARPQTGWSTPHQVAAEWPAARLLDFSTGDTAPVATVILPPQAGHPSTIVDYTPQQSQVRSGMAKGLDRMYVVEWLNATPATQHTTIDDYIEILDDIAERVGGRMNLVGDCQGGWLATIYAALNPEKVASLSIGAAPIDFHAGHGAIIDWMEKFSSVVDDPMVVYRSLVHSGDGIQRGQNQLDGFKMMEPAGEMTRLAELWANIGDDAYVSRYLDFVSWFETVQDMPGDFYLWTVQHLFVNNELIAGTLEVGGKTVDLANVTMPLYLLAGTRDHITPPEQVWALAEHAGTPAEQVHSRFFDAGHLGLFMGRRALNEHWSAVFGEISEQQQAEKAEADRKAKEAADKKAAAEKAEADRKAKEAADKKAAAEKAEADRRAKEAADKKAAAEKAEADRKAKEAADKQAAAEKADAEAAAPAKQASARSTTRRTTPAKRTTAAKKATAAKKSTPAKKTAASSASRSTAGKTAATKRTSAQTAKKTAPTRTAKKAAPRTADTATPRSAGEAQQPIEGVPEES